MLSVFKYFQFIEFFGRWAGHFYWSRGDQQSPLLKYHTDIARLNPEEKTTTTALNANTLTTVE